MRIKKFNKRCKKIFIFACTIFFVGMVYCNSYEATINAQVKNLESEIEVLNGDIDGLEMEKSNLTDFKKIYDLASTNGYQYQTNTSVAVVSKSE